jgi:glycosyltransferase involved in cell wall biosynthesis
MLEPRISVIIPTYNRGDTLVAAVQSVLAQTYRKFELIIVDDCSANPAAQTLVEAGIVDKNLKIEHHQTVDVITDGDVANPMLRIVRHHKNQKQAAARNTGAAMARGKWLAFLDDDDLFLPKKLSRQLAYMRKHKLRVSTTDFMLPDDRHRYVIRNSMLDPSWMAQTGRFLALPSTMMIEKTLYDEMGGFDPSPDMYRTEDTEFVYRLYLKGIITKVFKVFGEALSVYSGLHAAATEVEIKAIEALEKKHGQAFSQGDRASPSFKPAIEWKKTNVELLTHKPLMTRVKKFASLALRYPVSFASLALSVLCWAPPWARPKNSTHTGGRLRLYMPY